MDAVAVTPMTIDVEMRHLLDGDAPEVASYPLGDGLTLALLAVPDALDEHVEAAVRYWAFESGPRTGRWKRWTVKTGDTGDGIDVNMGPAGAGLRAMVRGASCAGCGQGPWFPVSRTSVGPRFNSGGRSWCLWCSDEIETILDYLRVEGNTFRAWRNPINQAEAAARGKTLGPYTVWDFMGWRAQARDEENMRLAWEAEQADMLGLVQGAAVTEALVQPQKPSTPPVGDMTNVGVPTYLADRLAALAADGPFSAEELVRTAVTDLVARLESRR